MCCVSIECYLISGAMRHTHVSSTSDNLASLVRSSSLCRVKKNERRVKAFVLGSAISIFGNKSDHIFYNLNEVTYTELKTFGNLLKITKM